MHSGDTHLLLVVLAVELRLILLFLLCLQPREDLVSVEDSVDASGWPQCT
jgi:hypothetical protein